ncbi:predicted protein [Postia placenta Mad-698-R]|nr:predicted protein [Postia placenta Mad-698-R]
MYMQYLRAGKVLYSQTFHGYPLSDSNQKRPSSVHLLPKKLAHQSTGTKGMCIASSLGKRSRRLVRMGHGYNYGNGEETLYYRRKSWRDIGIEFLEEHDGCATDILLPQQASSGLPLLQRGERIAMSPEPHIQTSLSEDVSTEGQSSVVPERCEHSVEHETMLHANFVTQRVRVPQEIYASKDRTFAPRVISVFRLHGAAGISLAAILRGETEGLEERALPALPDDMTSTKVSLRILWPGYEPFTKQITVRAGRRTVSIDRLVELVAKVLGELCQKRALVPTSDPVWRLGPGSITVDDLTLVGILHVSRSSIQPYERTAGVVFVGRIDDDTYQLYSAALINGVALFPIQAFSRLNEAQQAFLKLVYWSPQPLWKGKFQTERSSTRFYNLEKQKHICFPSQPGSANMDNGPAAAVDLEKACRENNGGAVRQDRWRNPRRRLKDLRPSLKIGSSKHAEVDTIVGNAIVDKTHCCKEMVYAVTAFVIKSINIDIDADVEG